VDATERQSFGKQIRRYRRRAGLTQEELAERAELSPRGLIYLERDGRRPQPGTARRLADALGLTEHERLLFLALSEGAGLAASDARPGQTTREAGREIALPVQTTPFVGREHELAAVVALLKRDPVRLLTLTGPGGTGKTRLAIQAAQEASDHFPGGVAFVPLAALADPALVLSAVAGALGIGEPSDRITINAVQASIGPRRVLLVLDNFEHLLAGAPTVGDLLTVCPQLVILATSRSPLHLSAEYEYPVPGMALPAEQHRPHLAVLARVDAVAFFLERARAVKPAFALTEENASAIVEICRRLDGLPLALELAAPRLRLFPPEALLARLEHRFDLLTGGAGDRPSRQRTLRDAIDWSYGLLTPEEQSLFARLGVFVGGCTIEAAEAVCNPEGGDLLERLTSLVEKSLLQGQGEQEERLSLLETIREYALERLDERGEENAIRRRHAAYFLALAERGHETALPAGSSPSRIEVRLRRFETEYANYTSALQWLREHHEGELGARLVVALAGGLKVRGRWRELSYWVDAFMPYQERFPALLRARFLRCVGDDIIDRERDPLEIRERGIAILNESVACYRQVGDEVVLARGLASVGMALVYHLDAPARARERAEELFTEALELGRIVGSRFAEVASLLGLAEVAWRLRGDANRAIALLEECLAIHRAAGDEEGADGPLTQLAVLLVEKGDEARSGAVLAESLAWNRTAGNKESLSLLLLVAGVRELRWGTHVGLMSNFREASERVPDSPWPGYWPSWLLLAAASASSRGCAEDCARLYGACTSHWGESVPRVLANFNVSEILDTRRAETRRRLGEAAWAAAWEEGLALSQNAAVSLALQVM
jgi:predicted ATPase/transcriptional regulator with XRE-family HTH domain